MWEWDNVSSLDLAAEGAETTKSSATNESGTGSRKGPRFTWTDAAHEIMLLALLGEGKVGAEGWAAASKALEVQSFLNSEG